MRPGGNILISGRNTSTLYLLARDGHIIWRLGGKHSDFKPAAAVKFAFQHHARLHPGNILTLFDNGAIPKVEPFSRPLELHLDLARRRRRSSRRSCTRRSSPRRSRETCELLPDGGALVGWGGVRRVTEFAPDGTVRFELKLPYGDTYRAFRLPWHGRPGRAARRGRRRRHASTRAGTARRTSRNGRCSPATTRITSQRPAGRRGRVSRRRSASPRRSRWSQCALSTLPAASWRRRPSSNDSERPGWLPCRGAPEVVGVLAAFLVAVCVVAVAVAASQHGSSPRTPTRLKPAAHVSEDADTMRRLEQHRRAGAGKSACRAASCCAAVHWRWPRATSTRCSTASRLHLCARPRLQPGGPGST